MQGARNKSTGAAGRPPASHVAAEKEKAGEQKSKEKTAKVKAQTTKEKTGKPKAQNVKGKAGKIKESKEKKVKPLEEKDTDTAMEDESKAQTEEMSTKKCKEHEEKDTDIDMVDDISSSPVVSAAKVPKETSLPPVAVSEVPSITDCVAQLTKKQFDFDPSAAAFWKNGERVPFVFLAHAFDSKFADNNHNCSEPEPYCYSSI